MRRTRERSLAIELMDGATNGVRLLSYVTDTLVPKLKPGDTYMDDLGDHYS